MTSVEEVIEAVGDHIQGSVDGGLDDDIVEEICQRLMHLLHGDGTPLANQSRSMATYDVARKLDYTVDMSTSDRTHKDIDNVWKVAGNCLYIL